MKCLRLDHPRVWRTYRGKGRLDSWPDISPTAKPQTATATLPARRGPSGRNYPEEWVASVTEARNPVAIPGEGLSRIAETGMTLVEAISRDPVRMLGMERASGGNDTGILVKLIDSGERLTVQVHPSRERALDLFGSPCGKTECWYFLKPDEGANTSTASVPIEEDAFERRACRPCVYYGFKPGVTRGRWKRLFEEQDITGMLGCLNRIEVEPGMVMLVNGGIPHAIGEGCFLVEVQEPTDYTIRVERTTPSGLQVPDELCHQGLGFDRMFDCFDYCGLSSQEARRLGIVPANPIARASNVAWDLLVGAERTDCFEMSRVRLEAGGTFALETNNDYRVLLVTDGACTLRGRAEQEKLHLYRGDQVFVPAAVIGIRFESPNGAEVLIFRGPLLKR